ncbi:ATPase/histidine kinase/Dna gyrase B/HSP90 domain-containing protein [Cardiosporidium cionae]|uniref:Protein-serine/threonine kinase n=1 Tax=Cardiosporidium cionae TaxID=476202 RepID=A0ABQ7J5K2_9APIC|nr:ATPase/histidine kinase/Dna gyrase B/HSP90 domain-containing protein [Cardiosporidium cionae]|eukprot:KAF8819261.1 ATPase/histidine kinase/Dna gyrase B/HSP90 domain-containing protein [Cardiosporidium cionae]
MHSCLHLGRKYVLGGASPCVLSSVFEGSFQSLHKYVNVASQSFSILCLNPVVASPLFSYRHVSTFCGYKSHPIPKRSKRFQSTFLQNNTYLSEEVNASFLRVVFNWIPADLVASIYDDFSRETCPIRYERMLTYRSKSELMNSVNFLCDELRIRMASQLHLLLRMSYKLERAGNFYRSHEANVFSRSVYLPYATSQLISLYRKLQAVKEHAMEFPHLSVEVSVISERTIPLVVCGIRELLTLIGSTKDSLVSILPEINSLMNDFLVLSISCGTIVQQFNVAYKRFHQHQVASSVSKADTPLRSINPMKERSIEFNYMKILSRAFHSPLPSAVSACAEVPLPGEWMTNATCEVLGIAFSAIEDARQLCVSQYLVAPSVKLWQDFASDHQENGTEMMFFNHIMRYVLLEIMKNSIASTTFKSFFSENSETITLEESSSQRKCVSPVYCILHHQSDGMWIRISDFGEGIEASRLDCIFSCINTHDPKRDSLSKIADDCIQGTYSCNKALSSQMEGYGMGLALCRAFVNYVGGQLLIESVVGEGTDVYIFFPSLKGKTAEKLPMEDFKYGNSLSTFGNGDTLEDDILTPSSIWRVHRSSVLPKNPPENLKNVDLPASFCLAEKRYCWQHVEKVLS